MPKPDAETMRRRAEIVADMRIIVPGEGVVDTVNEMRAFESDGLTAYRQLPLVVVLPETVAQVSRVLKYCNDRNIRVVPRGSGTSLSGGALPLEDAVLLVMSRFNRILQIDYPNRIIVAQPGVTNLGITTAVEQEGFYYAPDPSSQIACSIGGNVAENSGGVHCLKYGLTANNVLGIEMVLMNGEVVRLGGSHLDQEGYDLDAAAILLCEADGTALEVAEEIARMTEVLREAGASAITVSQSEAERLRFWSGRKNAFPAAGRISPDYYCMDGTIPPKQLAHVLARIEEMETTFGLRCANVFHAGDGNMHPLILFDANQPGELERAEAFGAAILALCVEVGGTITGEHGVGVEKIDSMCVQFRAQELDAFFAVKRAFDPRMLLNPNKAIPTLNRCAELGSMRVSGGVLPFAHLPRF